MNRQGKTHECLGSKDLPWRAKCRRMVEHVYSVFCFGSENWSWSQKQRMGNKGEESFVSMQKRKKMQTGAKYCTRAARVVRKIWVSMELPFFLSEVIAESTGRSRCYVVSGHKKRRGRVVTSGQFLKKGTPGSRSYVGHKKNSIKTEKLSKCDFSMTKISKQGGRLDTSLHVEARHEHGT